MKLKYSWLHQGLQAFVRVNFWLSSRCERLLPARFRIDGNRDFFATFVPSYLGRRQTVYDIGGGKHPCIPERLKLQHELRVVGFDIDQEELNLAPTGLYDATIRADICEYQGKQDADIVICQSLLEHVPDTGRAMESIASILKPGGKALFFAPSRNAVFARLNLMLPENVKRLILFSIYPQSRGQAGFKSYYDRCTPGDFRMLAKSNGLLVQEERVYFVSNYFFCFFPAYILWRLWMAVFITVSRSQAAETFSICAEKPALSRS